MKVFPKVTVNSCWLGLAIFGAAPGLCLASQLDPTEWMVQPISQVLSPPSGFQAGQAAGQTNQAQAESQSPWHVLFDNNPATFVTLTNLAAFTRTPSLVMDLGQTNAIERVVVCGTNNDLMLWLNCSTNSPTLPLGLIAVYVGNTPQTMVKVASCTIPYDAGNPINDPFDIRFSPAVGRYVRLELQTRVNWSAWSGKNNDQYGWGTVTSPVDQQWQISEMELYGSTNTVATNAVVLEANAPGPLSLAAADLSYYLSELTGQPHPIITPAQTNNYPGTLYCIQDLKPLAPDYKTMTNNMATGILPTNEVNIGISGRMVTFTGWPYRCVDWSVWEFLERQGVRWVYPDVHGDYVPPTGVNLAMLPLKMSSSAKSIYANWNASVFEPWYPWITQSPRQEYLYVWRNRWTDAWNSGPLGGGEIPAQSGSGSLDPAYAEGFGGYPHNMSTAMPPRILATNSAWWGSLDGINLTTNGVQFDMASSGAAAWLSAKVKAWDAYSPPANRYPLTTRYFLTSYNLLPLDAAPFSVDKNTTAANALYGGTNWYDGSILWVYNFGTHSSGAYYKLLNSIATNCPNQTIGGLAYQDLFDPPRFNYPSNVRMEVTMWGQPNLPITSPRNRLMKSALDTWRQRVSTMEIYDYALLLVDTPQQDPHLPVPMVSAMVGTARYLASINALNGGCQALLGGGNAPVFDSLKYNPWDFYAYPRVRWNTNYTASALENEFFTGYFREAAAPMLAYYQAMENNIVGNDVDMHYKGFCYWMDSRTFPLDILKQMQASLNEAQALATNWYVIHRINDMTNQFGWLLKTRGITNNSQLADYSSYPTVPATGTYTVNNASMSAVPYVPETWQVEHRNGDLNLNGPCEAAQTLNFTKAGNYRVDVVCAGNFYYNLGRQAVMNVMLGPSSTGLVSIANGFQTNSYVLNIPAASAFDVGVALPNTWSGLGYVTIRQINITAQ